MTLRLRTPAALVAPALALALTCGCSTTPAVDPAALPEDARVVVYSRRERKEGTLYHPSAESDPQASLVTGIPPALAGMDAGFHYLWLPAYGTTPIQGCPGADIQGRDAGSEAVVEIDDAYAEALDGIDDCESVVVLCWFHRSRRDLLRVHPRGDKGRLVEPGSHQAVRVGVLRSLPQFVFHGMAFRADPGGRGRAAHLHPGDAGPVVVSRWADGGLQVQRLDADLS